MLMTVKEVYQAMEGNFDDAVSRMMSERLVEKFMLKFLDDSSYSTLCEALEKDDYVTGFRAAHTLKGVCANLAFTKLQNSSSLLTEALREGSIQPKPVVDDLFANVQKDYNETVSAIKEYKESL